MKYTLLQMQSRLLQVDRVAVYVPIHDNSDTELPSDRIQQLPSNNNQSREEVIGEFQVQN